MSLSIDPAGKDGLEWAQDVVTEHHYRHAPVDPRSRPFAYLVKLHDEPIGCLIFGRMESTRCYQGKLTYGSYQELIDGKVKFDRWEVLNLARVWLDPRIQKGGANYIPSAATTVIGMALERVGFEYLMYALPVDCSFPYQIKCVMSYCDTRVHTGYIYQFSHFRLARMNDEGIATYMKIVPGLTEEQDAIIQRRSEQNLRSKRIRLQRIASSTQMKMFTAEAVARAMSGKSSTQATR